MNKYDGIEEKILNLIADGNTQEQTAKKLGTCVGTIQKRINNVDENRVKEAIEKGKKAREARYVAIILEGTEAGKTQAEIAENSGLSKSTIEKTIKQMNQDKLKEAREKARIAKEEKEAKDEATILKGIAEGETLKEIAQEIGLSESVIIRKKSTIDPSKIEEARLKWEKLIKEKVLEGLVDGKNQGEIAQELGVPKCRVEKTIKQIDKDKLQEAREKGIISRKEKIEKIKKFYNSTKIISYNELREKMENHTITKEEVVQYRNQIDIRFNTVTQDEIILMINAYIRIGQISQAISFLDTLINNKGMKKIEEKLLKIKKEVEVIQTKQHIRILLRENKNTYSEIAKIVGVSQAYVIQVKNEIEQTKNKGEGR